MNRPVTPENKSEIYEDSTICKIKRSVTVRIVDSTLPRTVHCPGIRNPYYKLPVGSIVIVLGSRTLNFTGVDDPQSTANTAYRIEGEIEVTIYEEVDEPVPNRKFRLSHSDLRLVEPANFDCSEGFSPGIIVALKQDIAYNKSRTLHKGQLFVTNSMPETPRGQPHRSLKAPIDQALYNVTSVRKNIRRLKVKNSADVLIMHHDLERVTRIQ
ncbi:hypothetical protein H2248_007245 [Termitomyces sp. 'cryptogamus']|nr:hypothetical protein H2248_007245 [Termitomyces sp. 'cryptogamus']